jgi:hypothetical protein
LVGALAGLVGAVVSLVLSIPIALLISPFQQAVIESLRNSGANVPPEFRQAFENAGSGILLFLSFVFMLFAGPLFAAIGGLIGAMVFRKPLPPPPAPPSGSSGFSGPASPSAPIDVPYSAG